MAELALQNGLGVALWIGAEYIVDMLAEYLSVHG